MHLEVNRDLRANHSDESSAPDTADGTVACYDRQQWTCSQCGRLYRDSVVFARHLQDHYRPVYLRELAGRQRGGGRGARRGRGRPRGQGWSRPFAPPRRSSSPAGAIEEEDEEAVEIGEDTQQVADPDAALERGGEVPAVPAEAPIEESQLGALLEEKEGTRLLIQLEDGTIHEITSYPPNLNLPALGEHDEVHLTGDASNSTSEPTVTLATLDQLSLQHFHQDTVPQQVVQQMTQQTTQRTVQQTTQQTTQHTTQQTTQQMAHPFRGAKRGRKRKGEVTDREPEVPAARRFKSVERQSAGKYNLRTTRKALVVDEEERYEDGSDYEGEGYSDFEDDYEGGNVAPPGGHDPRPPDPVEQELTGQHCPQKSIKDHRTGGPLSPSSTRELQNSECVDTPAIQAPEDYEDQNQVVEKFYRSVEQARMDRPKRPGRFRCDLCGKGFNQTLYLFRHIRKHTGEFTCSQCRRVFARKENLQNHACLGMMKSVNYPCTLCGKSFGSDRLLRRHTAKHTGQHMCNDCGKSYTTRREVRVHLARSNLTPPSPRRQQEFTNAAEFRRHQYEHTHVHRCGVCGGRFRNLALLNAHVCQGLPVECDACGQVFDTVSALDEHRPTHGEPQFKCELCGKAFFRGEALSKHPCVHVLDPSAGPDAASRKKAAPSLTPLVCEVCGSRFSSTSSLNVHKNLHGEKRFQCDVCGKRFHRKDLLLEHHAVHGDPTFPCPTCRKLFKTKKSLDVHMMIHSGVKRFKCSVCSKASNSLPCPIL
ncbi:regulator of sex-limitation, putative [Ixodes scapularis]|uniref:Regulator of sex-limitation, putative n=1 Tax=Ixodes scapularis TaxID=6945 RepID=B7QA73_IXOSC|nr:regulator of sex-limitation, putative [Ixodes scapularis]|eukprot:XP_002400013.1 regulator of sex-limitation, putative [Ixodes scapularis]